MGKTRNFYLTDRVYNRLVEISKDSELSLSSVIRLAINHFYKTYFSEGFKLEEDISSRPRKRKAAKVK